jgi:uncharacterized protein YndB with AHSA1/START domain
MVSVLLEQDMAHPVEKVWEILGDFGNLGWIDGPERIEVIGEGVGMTRRVHMTGMDPIDEVLQSIDETKLSFSYAIPRGLPFPVKDYLSSVRLETKSSGTTTVYWSCTCEGIDDSMPDKDIQAILQGTYQQMLDWLDAHLASR